MLKNVCLLVLFLISQIFSLYHPSKTSVVVNPNQIRVQLKDNNILKGSVSVLKNDKLLIRGIDYRFDYNLNILSILYSQKKKDTLDVFYYKLSFDLEKQYYHRDIDSVRININKGDTLEKELFSKTYREIENKDSPSRLNIGGHKSIGFTIGSGSNYSLEQSLNLNVSGNISEKVTVRAMLSDQSLPFQPQGNTESIKEIDRVFVEVNSPKISGIMGDYYIEQEKGYFNKYNKKVQGLKATYKSNNYSISASGALSEGAYNYMELQGEERNQGPYRLTSKDGQTDIIVLANTEKIYVDGQLKKRGENNDYTIEYSNGYLYFTQNCLITSDNIIQAEYEYSEQEYRRNIITSEAKISLFSEKLNIEALFIKESDDYKNHFQYDLDENDLNKIRQNKKEDNTLIKGAKVISADSVIKNMGFYIYSEDGFFPDSHYIYHMPGDTSLYRSYVFYKVNFICQGEGYGDYVKDTAYLELDPSIYGTYETRRIFYRYIGKGLGNYMPGYRIESPRERIVSSLIYDLDISDKAKVSGEITGSSFNINTLNINKNVELGGASTNKAFLESGSYVDQGGIGKIRVSGSFEKLTKKYNPFERIENSYNFYKKWNVDILNEQYNNLSKYEADMKYVPYENYNLEGSGGYLELHDTKAKRAGINLDVKKEDLANLSSKNEFISSGFNDTTSDVIRTQNNLVFNMIKGKELFGAYTRELIKNNIRDQKSFSYLYNDFGVGFNGNIIGDINYNASIDYRSDKKKMSSIHTDFIDTSRSYTIKNSIYINKIKGTAVNLDLINRRSRKLLDQTWQQVNSDLVNFNTYSNILNGAVNQRIQYKLTAEKSKTTIELFEYAGEGLGDYKKDPLTGDYIPYSGGNYVYAGTAVDTNSASRNINLCQLNYNLKFLPGKLPALKTDKGFFKDIILSTNFISDQEKYPDSYRSDFYKYVPEFNPNLVTSKKCSKYNLSLRQDIAVQPSESNLYLRLRYFPSYIYYFNYYGGDKKNSNNISFEVRYKPVKKMAAGHNFSYEKINRKKNYSESDTDLFIIGDYYFESSISYSLNRIMTVPIKLGVGISRDIVKGNSVPYLSLEPGLVINLIKKGKIQFTYEFGYVSSSEEMLYYEMAKGFSNGLSHRIRSDMRYAINKYIQMNFYYYGEISEELTKPVNRANFELKAFF